MASGCALVSGGQGNGLTRDPVHGAGYRASSRHARARRTKKREPLSSLQTNAPRHAKLLLYLPFPGPNGLLGFLLLWLDQLVKIDLDRVLLRDTVLVLKAELVVDHPDLWVQVIV